jgi:hypothetical protein
MVAPAPKGTSQNCPLSEWPQEKVSAAPAPLFRKSNGDIKLHTLSPRSSMSLTERRANRAQVI